MACIRRRFEDNFVENDWESWERLSYRKLRRNCTPARCSVTVFARPRYNPLQEVPNPAESGAKRASTDPTGTEPEGKRLRPLGEEWNRSSDIEDKTETSPEVRETIDPVSQKHGPFMQNLTSEEQSWLLKMHRNLGHPGAQKLLNLCKHLKCDDRILKAVPDLRCSTCQETKGPHIPRPSAIHSDHDFGDVVSMDGVVWTNQNGDHFHFFHFVDQSTSFQTAVVAPSRTPSEAIKALCNGWIRWAGSPATLVVDSAVLFRRTSTIFSTEQH